MYTTLKPTKLNESHPLVVLKAWGSKVMVTAHVVRLKQDHSLSPEHEYHMTGKEVWNIWITVRAC